VLIDFRVKTDNQSGETDYISHKTVALVVSSFSVIFAVLFLIGAILGLYFETDPGWRLLMLSLFTVGFACVLGLLTNARRQDVFAATAAYVPISPILVSSV
jgi:energy-converting hydrogenase Eha subunit C